MDSNERVEEIRRQVGYWIKCAAYNQPLMGVAWERSENQRWLDVADKIIEFCAAALAQAERERDELSAECAKLQALVMEEGLERAKAEDMVRDLTFSDDSGHSRKMSVAEWITFWKGERDAARAEVERLKKELRETETDLAESEKECDAQYTDLARVRAALEDLVAATEALADSANLTVADRALDKARAALEGR